MSAVPSNTATEVSPPATPVPYYSQGLRARFNIDAAKVSASTPLPSAEEAKYANISYNVNEAAYHARSAARLAAGGLENDVLPGWPKSLDGPLCWKGVDFKDEEFVLRLSEDEKTEISAALVHFKGENFFARLREVANRV